MRSLRFGLLATALSAALALPVQAQAPGGTELLLDLCINGRCVGVAAVVERASEVLLDRDALLAAGIGVEGLPTERIGERDYVPLSAINHGSTYAIDHAQLRLDLHLRAELLPRQHGDLRQRPEMETAPSPWSAFLNYSATLGDDRQNALFADAALGRGHVALRSTASWDEFLGARRGLTRLEIDQPGALRRWTFGDQYAIAADPLGGGVLMGGAGVERAFDQDPYLVTFPQPFYSGVMETPGTVEVYSNGVLIGRQELVAGPFTLDHLGVQPGRSDVQIVVRDPFGNRSELGSIQYYGSSGRMLAAGLSEYAVRIGAPRTAALGGDYATGRIAAQAWYRRGLGDAFTLGGRVEGDDTLTNAGMDAVLRLPFGELGMAVAGSRSDDAGSGQATSATYGYASQHWSFGLGTRRADAAYRNLGDPFALTKGRLRRDDYASVAVSPAGPVSLQLFAGRRRREGALAEERSAGLTGTWRLRPRAQLLFGVQRFEGANGADTSALLSLNVSLERDQLGASVRRMRDADGDERTSVGLDARRSRPSNEGWGYDLSVQHDDVATSGFGQVEYQGRAGRYMLQAESFDGDARGRAIVSGALVAIGGRMFATPPLDAGFALVRVPGLAGVPVLRENLEVGRTDARGDLLMRDLLPFYANKVGLDESAVPAGFATDVPRRDVQVPRNTGALVVLDAAPVHAITGRFVRGDGASAEAAGDRAWLDTPAGRTDAPLGRGGRFYLEDLGPGRHAVQVDGANGTWNCVVVIPQGQAAAIIDLGDIACERSGDTPQ